MCLKILSSNIKGGIQRLLDFLKQKSRLWIYKGTNNVSPPPADEDEHSPGSPHCKIWSSFFWSQCRIEVPRSHLFRSIFHAGLQRSGFAWLITDKYIYKSPENSTVMPAFTAKNKKWKTQGSTEIWQMALIRGPFVTSHRRFQPIPPHALKNGASKRHKGWTVVIVVIKRLQKMTAISWEYMCNNCTHS